ncbi:MAG: DNA-binding protein [Nanoarchaeota archaeon]|nr:DNA-binding protein [Nanoarchaeota archaeon]MBU1445549.1 DNA-binding protein [Nanoarchaeota archaeon]MBU2406985.1 DNA-binding protein [Nanoarchaeota archaeon]MBU2420326.1 DNA-binding protein [Nanoarchaeota archaeon]MBU2475214.1 DNA-binding protein [Nanoarchaeota archaeon]
MEEQLKLQQQIKQLDESVKQYLTKEAITRYGNLKSAHPELAIQVAAIILQAINSGQIKEKITDDQLKNILKQFQQPKKEFKITRK